MTESYYIKIEVRTDCPDCSQSLPLNAPVERLACAFCGRPILVPESDLGEMFPYVESHYADLNDADTSSALSPEEEARARQETILGDSCDLRFQFDRATPVCSGCGEPLAVADLPPEQPHRLICACGTAYAAIPASEGLASQVDSALQLIHAEPPADGAGPEDTPISCTQCGAALTLSRNTRRVCPCEHCGVQLFLPEELWNRLHPPPKLVPWYVRFLEE